MAKWEYQGLMVVSAGPDNKVKRDRDGLYIDWWNTRLRLVENDDWKEGYRFAEAEYISRIPETHTWTRELDLLN